MDEAHGTKTKTVETGRDNADLGATVSWQPGETVRFETKRTVIRTFTPDELTDRVVAWFSDPDIMINLGMRMTSSRRRLRELVESHDNVLQFMLGIHLKESGLMIGWVRIRCKNARGTTTRVIGDRDYWRQGYGFEVSEGAVGFMFETLGLHKVYFTAYGENKSIQGLNEKLGFKLEGIQRKHQRTNNGNLRDLYEYGMLDRECGPGRSPCPVEVRAPATG